MLIDLRGDVVELTRRLCDIESVSGNEKRIVDLIEAALRECAHLELLRDGHALVARTRLGRPRRVVIAGHTDTVPVGVRPGTGEPNLPTWTEDDVLWGRGTCDMKGGVAVALSVAAQVAEPLHDVTYVFYDCEEIEATRNGLKRLVERHPDWLAADFAVLCEPTNSIVEGGCNGTIRVEVALTGTAAHSARAWVGDNAIHKAAPLLAKLAAYQAETVHVDGLDYRESLSAVGIRGGTAGNVIPDSCVLTVNYRFAPSRTGQQAEAFLREFFDGFEVSVTDLAPGARPGLDDPVAADFVARSQAPAQAKVGWTDVARFSEMGIPAVNFGPGDPLFAHKDDEHCQVAQIRTAQRVLSAWLGG